MTGKAADTAIHRWVRRCRDGDFPAAVARLPSGWVVMGERQVFTGYCLLLADPVVEHLNVLRDADRMQFLADLARLGDAVLACTGALRINYALFGNAEPALHAHVIPRFADEPEATSSTQPWAFDWTAAPEFTVAVHGELKRRIAARLSQDAAPTPQDR
jgi:diadenosine tetraphosphate (Ap4A) HIT family hydrolase